MATYILYINNDMKPLGKKWITNFLQRNPTISSVVGRRIEAVRILNTDLDKLHLFFELFYRKQSEFNVKIANIWNIDEIGIVLGVYYNSYVLASSSRRRTFRKIPNNREWVLIIKAVSAGGSSIRPIVIFKGKSV